MKMDFDTQAQMAAFDNYLMEDDDNRQHSASGAAGYKEEEWMAFESGWNAAKQHFGGK